MCELNIKYVRHILEELLDTQRLPTVDKGVFEYRGEVNGKTYRLLAQNPDTNSYFAKRQQADPTLTHMWLIKPRNGRQDRFIGVLVLKDGVDYAKFYVHDDELPEDLQDMDITYQYDELDAKFAIDDGKVIGFNYKSKRGRRNYMRNILKLEI